MAFIFICVLNRKLLLLFVFITCQVFGLARDTIGSTEIVRDPDSIESSNGAFKLGFFSPNGSTHRYVGVWFNDGSEADVVWVANRDSPLNDSLGIMTVSKEGNLVVLNGMNEMVWSSNVTKSATNSSAQLLDSGNLVLTAGTNSGGFFWESFRSPCSVILPTMKFSVNLSTGISQSVSSWRTPVDPSQGSFSVVIHPLKIPEIYIFVNNSLPFWRSGPWNGRIFIGIYFPSGDYYYGDDLFSIETQDGTTSLTMSPPGQPLIESFMLSSEGVLHHRYWDVSTNEWQYPWVSKATECDVYGKCGAFGICNAQEEPICSCLRGFEPKSSEEWSRGEWSSGCIRKEQLLCERNSSTGVAGKSDEFVKLNMTKVPENPEQVAYPEDQCQSLCLQSCSCVAFAYDGGIGCMTWNGNLTDLQKYPHGGSDVYIRVAYSELDGYVSMNLPKKGKRDLKSVIIIVVVLGLGTLLVATVCSVLRWRCMAENRVKRATHEGVGVGEHAHPINISTDTFGDEMQKSKLKELPLFTFEMLASATKNFQEENVLGQGGFGPVYRGALPNGEEIAVKRLSRASGQGLEEFMNEVILISKLQHRNLVRLLGCCTDKEEKMLVYEFMPNKCLDAYLFDKVQKEHLPWKKRFEIIGGIGRGLLYLHRDSRLRIIHRDLKAANVLLDHELHPKISDFGMARIFRTDQDQANTAKVVGTLGYMAPEYAMEGTFSEKSDVYSFGVLILEIVSGRKNSSFYNDEHSNSLLKHAWKLWKENRITALIDAAIFDPSFSEAMIRCIQIGLLCVQEYADDRPSVSTVLSMHNTEIVDLPLPQQPAFCERHVNQLKKDFPHKSSSANITITELQGR